MAPNLTLLCWYKSHWFISFLILMIIFNAAMSAVYIDSNGSLYSLLNILVFCAHVYIVMFYKNTDCLQLAVTKNTAALAAAKAAESS